MAGRETMVALLMRRAPGPGQRLLMLALAIALVAVATWLDLVGGASLDAHLFYLPGVALAAWIAGRWPGAAVACLAAAAWSGVDWWSADAARRQLLPANAATALAFFLLAAHLAAVVHRHGRDLAELAGRDPLTGLANRRAFISALRRAVAPGRRVAVAMLDVDHLKEVNDRWGHAAGDLALRAVARAAEESLRRGDLAGRLGGDEFALLLPDADAEAATQVAERLRERLRHLQEDRPAQVTVSVGVVDDAEAVDGEALLARADRHLYGAKSGGRNAVVGPA